MIKMSYLFQSRLELEQPSKPEVIDKEKAMEEKVLAQSQLTVKPEDYCIKQITTEEYLWDLRFWKANHNYGEVLQWLSSIIMDGPSDHKNCGHTVDCIKLLIKNYRWNLENIAELIMRNNKVGYQEKLAEAFRCSKCGKEKLPSIFSDCTECEKKEADEVE